MFETIQGEGVYTGVPAIFVRLQGCPVGCPWCDTKHTWTLDENLIDSVDAVVNKSEESERFFGISDLGLLALFEQQGYNAKHVVITGGEPCMYDLTGLTELLHERGFTSQIETSGTYGAQTHLERQNDFRCHEMTALKIHSIVASCKYSIWQ